MSGWKDYYASELSDFVDELIRDCGVSVEDEILMSRFAAHDSPPEGDDE